MVTAMGRGKTDTGQQRRQCLGLYSQAGSIQPVTQRIVRCLELKSPLHTISRSFAAILFE